MILRALYDLAVEEELAEDLDYQMTPVAFVIGLGAGAPQLMERMDPPADGKGKPKPRPMLIPRAEVRTSAPKAFLLVDKADYVFGWEPLGKQKPEALAKRLALFRERVWSARQTQAPDSMEIRALDAVLAFLDAPLPERISLLERRLSEQGTEAARKDVASALFAFQYLPAGPDGLVHRLPGLVAHWKVLRAQNGGDTTTRCLVTGSPCTPVDIHPSIKGVPGGNTAGAALISFNSPAFESYGWSGNANAPISREAAETCATALNRLLSSRFVHPDKGVLAKRHLRLSDDTVALFWNAGGVSDVGFLAQALDSPDGVRVLLESPWNGKNALLEDPSVFHTLILSGAQGRSIIRGMHTSTTQVVAGAVQRYLEDVSIERPYGRGVGAFPLWVMLRAIAAFGKMENLPPDLAGRLYLAAIQDRPLPSGLLAAAARRTRTESASLGSQDPKKRYEAENALAARAALIRACLVRPFNAPRKEIPVSLDTTCTETAYVLGRLLAVLDKAQSLAIPGANATIVDRYYGTASTTPATVFPTLLQKGHQHLGKLRSDSERPWAFKVVDKTLTEVTEHLEATPFPKTFSLADQGLFALGFYHQRQAFFQSTKKDDPSSTNA